MRKGFNWQSCRRLFVPSLLVVALAAVVYFGLVPNRRQEMFGILPLAIGRQIGLHDDFNNFAAFTVLGILVLRLGRGSADRRNPARLEPEPPIASGDVDWTGLCYRGRADLDSWPLQQSAGCRHRFVWHRDGLGLVRACRARGEEASAEMIRHS
jgi:hypothetical protein